LWAHVSAGEALLAGTRLPVLGPETAKEELPMMIACGWQKVSGAGSGRDDSPPVTTNVELAIA